MRASGKKQGWNQDHFTRKAQKENYKARSAFKLEEIDRKYKIFQSKKSVLDLGCAPGSWLQYVHKHYGKHIALTGIDTKECRLPFARCLTADIFDFLNPGTETERAKLQADYDVILSDMAPSTTGSAFTDQQRSLRLAEAAWNIAEVHLAANGNFVCKIFESQDAQDFINSLKKYFQRLTRYKPKSTRSQSTELYMVGLGFQADS